MKIWRKLWNEEDGAGVVEAVLILVVLIALVIIFKEQMVALVEKIFANITGGVDTILS